MPHPSSQPSKPAHSPMRRPRRLRSRPFSSRGSAVSRRSPALPRLAASSPSGTFFNTQRKEVLGSWRQTTTQQHGDPTSQTWMPRWRACGMAGRNLEWPFGIAMLTRFIIVMVLRVSTAWRTSRLRSLSSMSHPLLLGSLRGANALQVRLRCQGHVHEPRGRPGRCRAFRFRSSRQGGRERQAYR